MKRGELAVAYARGLYHACSMDGVEDKPERRQRPEKYLWTVHAEENVILRAVKSGKSLDGATMYVTHQPCCRCARMMINAGIKRVVVGDGELKSMPKEEFEVAVEMFKEAKIEVIKDE